MKKLNYLPSMVKEQLNKMPKEKQNQFTEEFDRKTKSIIIAYLVWLFPFMQYGYLGKWGIQIIYWVTGGGFMIWWFIDLFRMVSLVKDKNKDIAIEVMKDIKSINK